MRNELSENCPYKDAEAVLYALMQVTDDVKIIISASETSVYNNYLHSAKNKDADISIDFETCDEVPYQLVYGSLIFHDIEWEELKDCVVGNKNYAMITLDVPEYGKLTASAYADIEFYEDIGNGNTIPFVALMQTISKEEEHISITMFPCCNRTVWENMVNRDFLLISSWLVENLLKLTGLLRKIGKNILTWKFLETLMNLPNYIQGKYK